MNAAKVASTTANINSPVDAHRSANEHLYHVCRRGFVLGKAEILDLGMYGSQVNQEPLYDNEVSMTLEELERAYAPLREQATAVRSYL